MKTIRAEELLERKVSRFNSRNIKEKFLEPLAQAMPGRGSRRITRHWFEKIRNASDKTENALKKKLPCISLSGLIMIIARIKKKLLNRI